MHNNPRGSTWAKWDLHVHTPASIVHGYDGGEEGWQRYINDLEALPPEFKVLGINDYLFIDGYERLLREKRENHRLKNIELLLPVIELRVDKFAGIVKRDESGQYSRSDWNRINIHIVFDQLEPELIRQQFLGGLAPCYQLIPDAEHLRGKWEAIITPASITQLGQQIISSVPEDRRGEYASPMQEGFNNLCVSLPSITGALQKHVFHGRHLLAIGKTEWAHMKWDDHSIAEKKHVINSVDLVFTAAESPAAYVSSKNALAKSKVNAKLVDCSDAHIYSNSTNKDRIGNCHTWIKADYTFKGLQHAVAEFDQRVFIGDTPDKVSLVDSNRTKYIDSVEVRKKAGSILQDKWFDSHIPLNQDLVAIIGNKGSGKSALSDITALVGNTKNFRNFSFLSPSRFRDPRSKLAGHFVGSLHWRDNDQTSRQLDEDTPSSSVERVKYLPQSYLETLCNELAHGGPSDFDSELRQIIYTHVPTEDQLGYASLDQLLSFKVSELEEEKKIHVARLIRLNSDIVAVENKLLPSFKAGLEELLSTKKHELASHVSAKPEAPEAPIAEPLDNAEGAQAARLIELEQALQSLAEEENTVRRRKADAVRTSAHVARIIQAIGNFEKGYIEFKRTLAEMLAEAGLSLPVDDLVRFSTTDEPLRSITAEAKGVSDAQDLLLISLEEGSLQSRRASAETEVRKIKDQLGEQQRLRLAHKELLAHWERTKLELIGDESKINSISWIEKELADLADLPSRREALSEARREAVKAIHAQIKKVADEYRVMYAPIQTFAANVAKMDMPLPLAFNVRVVDQGFEERFLSRINRQAKGTFAGVDESSHMVRDELKGIDLSNADSVVDFVEKINDMLHFDRRPSSNGTMELAVQPQLRKGQKIEDLYNEIFGLNYLAPKYSLTYGGQEISQLSPGERGLLLLVFYLLVDKDDIPLVIDQPEENLDNQTIFKVLVTCIKKAKQRRQVIMVTHNPNLAVVCDAEQIIYASCDKANREFSYESGAIESPNMKARILEILEGTQPAFDNRRIKYSY